MKAKLRQALTAVGLAVAGTALIVTCIAINISLTSNVDLTLPWDGPTCLRCWW